MAASHIRNLENYMDLKICILTDWTIKEVSDQGRDALLPQVLFLGWLLCSEWNMAAVSLPVDDQYPVHELQCRSGQQEADFLKLLRSTFPLLAPSTPFESFITDPTNRLQPLEVQAFTPEQICRAAGNSALYIRLKVLHPTIKQKTQLSLTNRLMSDGKIRIIMLEYHCSVSFC